MQFEIMKFGDGAVFSLEVIGVLKEKKGCATNIRTLKAFSDVVLPHMLSGPYREQQTKESAKTSHNQPLHAYAKPTAKPVRCEDCEHFDGCVYNHKVAIVDGVPCFTPKPASCSG